MKARAFIAAAVIAATAGIGAGITTAGASGPLHQYFWDTSSHAGNGAAHAGVNLIRNGVTYFNRTVWEQNQEGGETMWFGPKDLVYGAGVTEQACWYYTRPAFSSSTVIFDITYGSTPTILWSSGNLTLSALGYEPSIWPLEKTCHNVVLNGTAYDKFQVRVRAVAIHYDPNDPQANALKVYKTSRQDL